MSLESMSDEQLLAYSKRLTSRLRLDVQVVRDLVNIATASTLVFGTDSYHGDEPLIEKSTVPDYNELQKYIDTLAERESLEELRYIASRFRTSSNPELKKEYARVAALYNDLTAIYNEALVRLDSAFKTHVPKAVSDVFGALRNSFDKPFTYIVGLDTSGEGKYVDYIVASQRDEGDYVVITARLDSDSATAYVSTSRMIPTPGRYKLGSPYPLNVKTIQRAVSVMLDSHAVASLLNAFELPEPAELDTWLSKYKVKHKGDRIVIDAPDNPDVRSNIFRKLNSMPEFKHLIKSGMKPRLEQTDSGYVYTLVDPK